MKDDAQRAGGAHDSIATEPGLPSQRRLEAVAARSPEERARLAALSDLELRARLDEVDQELATLRRRIEELCRQGAALADEQHRRAGLESARDSVELPSGSFRALARLNG